MRYHCAYLLSTITNMSLLPGRNDPCHCGSGLKYKKCHEARDREAAGTPRLRLLAGAPESARRRMLNIPPAAELNRAWELEIAPVPGLINNDPAARLAIVFVVAPPFVLACETVNRPSAEPGELAAMMAREVLGAVENSGVAPTHVSIRQPTLLKPLADALIPHGIGVMLEEELPGVADAIQSLLAHVYGGIVPLSLLRSQPETWAGWGMPPERVARMFDAAAVYHRAAPWSVSSTEMPIYVSRSGGHEWTAVVLGGAGNQTGLTFYHDATDLERMVARDESEPAAAFNGMQSEILALLFNTRAEIPQRMREEIKRARWDVAGPSAYPTLLVMNTPGGGIRQQHFDDLLAAVVSVPRFVAAYAPVFAGELPDDSGIVWTDPETGVTCRLEHEDEFFPAFSSAPSVLHPAGAQGAGAQPLAALNELSTVRSVTRTLTRYRAWLRKPAERKPPTEATVGKHADIARYFIEHCAYGSLKPVSAVNEYDLRVFLYDWYPRTVGGTARAAQAMLVSIRRFFEFLEERESIQCPWAWPIIADSDTFSERRKSFPGGYDWDERVESWRTENTLDLIARLLVPVDEPQAGIPWGETMGAVEHLLHREAHQLWLACRDDAVRSGISAPPLVLAYVFPRQRDWANSPNANCGGLTPKAAIARERGKIAAQ